MAHIKAHTRITVLRAAKAGLSDALRRAVLRTHNAGQQTCAVHAEQRGAGR